MYTSKVYIAKGSLWLQKNLLRGLEILKNLMYERNDNVSDDINITCETRAHFLEDNV